ncbi:MAG: polysaccharide biosynthesis protein [Syntrophomonadaceae bacterium]|nr:polysaccharide biosynthesis protein [Syntrophomonadaceae bacterium]
MAKRTLVYGAAILLGANLFNRVLGFIYQYLIMTKIGGEAYGLFAQVFPVYMMALVLTTAGIPLAVSKLVSEEVSLRNFRQAKAIFRLALGILSVSGALVTVILYVIASRMGELIFSDPRVIPVLIICTPAIFIVSVSSAYRGYFQGLQNMLPTAFSQTLEQIVRVSCGYCAALYLLPQGIAFAAVGLALGMVIGEAAGLLAIITQYRIQIHHRYKDGTGQLSSRRESLARIWQLSSPVTAGRLLSTGLTALNALLIPGRLQIAGYSARQATTLFGQLGGAGFSLLNFPSVFTFALATSLVPAVAEATAQGAFQIIKDRSSTAIRGTIVIGLPCLVTLFYFAEPMTALFNSATIAPVLRVLTIGGIFSYLQQTTTAILQGLGKTFLPVAHSIAAAGVRVPLLYWLTGLPDWGLIGSAWAFIAGYFIVAALNIAAIVRQTGMTIDLKRFAFQPLIAAGGMLLTFLLASQSRDASIFQNLEALVAGVLVYFIILVLNGGIKIPDRI